MYVIEISLPYLCYINVDTPNTLNTTCIYQEHSQGCLVSILINVTKLLMINRATEVSYVSIKASECEQPHNYSINPNTQVETFNATFNCECSTGGQINVNITVFDKCYQPSVPELINCTFGETEDTS